MRNALAEARCYINTCPTVLPKSFYNSFCLFIRYTIHSDILSDALLCNILSGGERGIRTLETVNGLLLFESSAFNHSAISPRSILPASPFQQNSRLFLALWAELLSKPNFWGVFPVPTQPFAKKVNNPSICNSGGIP